MRRREGRKRRWSVPTSTSGGVNLISMMDVLTVLLLFLLKSYVAGGEIMVPPVGVELPASSAEQPPPASVVVAIDDDEILVGNERVVGLADAMAGDQLEIAPLTERLQAIRHQQEEIARLRGTPADPPAATIQGDREIEFQVLQRVMYTLGLNGFEHIALAVIQKS